MTDKPLPLPGLEHLISVLKSHGVEPKIHPPTSTAPRAGEMVLGAPLDPLLAAVYESFDGGELGDLFILVPPPYQNSMISINEECRRGFDPRIEELLLYGAIQGLAEYFATVPSLAGADGIQPVIYMDFNEPPPYLTFWPIASSVDRAFDFYAHYADAYLNVCGSFDFEKVPPPGSGLFFPESVVSHIARDEKLVEMLQAGRFKKFVAPEPDSQAWVENILNEARALH